MKAKSEIRGSLHCGGKSAASGRDDDLFGEEKRATARAGWERFYIPPHRDETAMNGAPGCDGSNLASGAGHLF